MLEFLQACSKEGFSVMEMSTEGVPSCSERQGEEFLQQESAISFSYPSDNVPMDKTDKSD